MLESGWGSDDKELRTLKNDTEFAGTDAKRNSNSHQRI